MTHLGVSGHQSAPLRVWRYAEDSLTPLLESAWPLVGLSSLAAGADQLFARMVLAQQGQLHVVLPCHSYEKSFEDADDLRSFHDLLAAAKTIERLNFASPSEEAFLAAGKRVVDLADQLIAVWDGLPARGRGGTADIVEYAEAMGVPVARIWPEGVER